MVNQMVTLGTLVTEHDVPVTYRTVEILQMEEELTRSGPPEARTPDPLIESQLPSPNTGHQEHLSARKRKKSG
jgi:hypothetical protein